MNTNYNKNEKTLVILLNEEIDQNTADRIKRNIDDEIEKYIPRKVIFDFTNITFMDSSGIGLILGRYKLVKLIDGEMEIKNVNKAIKRILDMSGIERIIKIYGKKDITNIGINNKTNNKYGDNEENRTNANNYANEHIEKSKYNSEINNLINGKEDKNEGIM